jgi:lipid A 3-O-deacylase
MKRLILILAALLLLCNPLYPQENPMLQKGSWNFGIWTGGGSSISRTSKGTQLWLTGGRFGKVLTTERGHGAFRGQLEYALEAIPSFLIFQDSTVYGFDVTPLLFRWNFTGAKKLVPYFELGAGMLITTDDVPARTFPVNFTPQAGLGFHVFTKPKQAFTFTFKYMHISNGGLDHPNPGINSLQMMIGYQWSR